MKSCWPHGQRGERNLGSRDCIAQGLEMLHRLEVMVCGENPTVILMYEVKLQAVAVTMKAL